MPRSLTPLLAAALLVLASPAHAWTVGVDTTLDCNNGSIVPPPVGETVNATSGKVTVDDLVVKGGKTLKVTGADSKPSCVIVATNAITVEGSVRYDQRDDATGTNNAGNLFLFAGKAINVPTGGTISASGLNASLLGTSDGGKAGSATLRAPSVTVAGVVRANGGPGKTGTGSENGGNGGGAGIVNVIADGPASIGTGVFEAKGGAGGAGGALSPVIPPTGLPLPGLPDLPSLPGGLLSRSNVAARANGTNGAGGVVRRNAVTGARAGSVDAVSQPVNEAPTGLRASPAAAGVALSWQDNAAEETGYAILRRARGASWKLLGMAQGSSHNDVSSFEQGVTYDYAVLPVFALSVWPEAFPFSNQASIDVPRVHRGAQRKLGRFSVNRFFKSHYRLRRGTRSVALRIRSYGAGKLRIQMRVRVMRAKRARKAAARACRSRKTARKRRDCLTRRSTVKRTLRQTFVVTRGMNLLRLRLPSRLDAGGYRMSLTTIADDRSTKTVRKRVRFSFRR